MKKIFYLFAGVNGAGKSTLYNLAMINQNIKNTIRINTDEIVREIGDWRNNSDQLKAAKMAINLRNECFLYGKSFNEETTLTGKSILKIIDRAKELGYELQLFYVGVSSTEIAKERIKNRYYGMGKIIKCKIEFTELGYRNYKIISHLRPNPIEKNEKNRILTFNEPEDSLFFYFRQFGENIKILEPKSLKQKLKDFYKKALENYEKN